MGKAVLYNFAHFASQNILATLLSKFTMGLHFGQLGTRVRGVLTYTLSPFEQRAFAGAVKNGIPNMVRRFSSKAFIVGFPLGMGYFIYDWGEKEHVRYYRKNPKDFEH